ncbi:hypothetical protein KC19_5G129300, partial [Ceratodon purpureus]
TTNPVYLQPPEPRTLSKDTPQPLKPQHRCSTTNSPDSSQQLMHSIKHHSSLRKTTSNPFSSQKLRHNKCLHLSRPRIETLTYYYQTMRLPKHLPHLNSPAHIRNK